MNHGGRNRKGVGKPTPVTPMLRLLHHAAHTTHSTHSATGRHSWLVDGDVGNGTLG